MREFKVILKGFYHEVSYSVTVAATDRVHAVKIAAALFNHCYMRSEVTEV